jgi:acetate CoA/acetoacetate CoA-transferase beta subunit
MPGAAADVVPGGSFIDSATAFCLVRGGHVDSTVLGALEVDEKEPVQLDRSRETGPRNGRSHGSRRRRKKSDRRDAPYTKREAEDFKTVQAALYAVGVVSMIVKEMGVMEITPEGIVLKEYNPNTRRRKYRHYGGQAACQF